MNTVILAAGMEKRMHSELPKVLHPLACKPLIQHVIDTFKKLHPSRLCVIHGHADELIIEAIKDQDVLFAGQVPQLGTGHVLMQATSYLDDDAPTVTFYGDVLYARLRPGAVLERAAHVGNFVEVKNSTLGIQSKANHLNYFDDAEVGERVDIVAGTTTCNYDGANKFTTVIEDDAFIVSDAQLVAPVRVRKGPRSGAGTTLTQDALAGKLTPSRPQQIVINTWQRQIESQSKE